MRHFPKRFEHDGVEGLRAGRFDGGINTACILYRIDSTLIDTGPPNQWQVVRRFIREREVDRVLVTHHHEDHSGNAAHLKHETGAVVFAPAKSIDPMRDGFRLLPYQLVAWGTPGRLEPQPAPEETVAENGLRLRAVPAPGHSPDMTCYLEPDRGWLFTGDLYIASKPRFMRADEDVNDQIESLRQVLDLDFETMFCAHRGVIHHGPASLRAKLDYLVSLRDEVRDLHARGRTVNEITRELLGRETIMSYLTFFNFSKRNLVRGCLTSPP